MELQCSAACHMRGVHADGVSPFPGIRQPVVFCHSEPALAVGICSPRRDHSPVQLLSESRFLPSVGMTNGRGAGMTARKRDRNDKRKRGQNDKRKAGWNRDFLSRRCAFGFLARRVRRFLLRAPTAGRHKCIRHNFDIGNQKFSIRIRVSTLLCGCRIRLERQDR